MRVYFWAFLLCLLPLNGLWAEQVKIGSGSSVAVVTASSPDAPKSIGLAEFDGQHVVWSSVGAMEWLSSPSQDFTLVAVIGDNRPCQPGFVAQPAGMPDIWTIAKKYGVRMSSTDPRTETSPFNTGKVEPVKMEWGGVLNTSIIGGKKYLAVYCPPGCFVEVAQGADVRDEFYESARFIKICWKNRRFEVRAQRMLRWPRAVRALQCFNPDNGVFCTFAPMTLVIKEVDEVLTPFVRPTPPPCLPPTPPCAPPPCTPVAPVCAPPEDCWVDTSFSVHTGGRPEQGPPTGGVWAQRSWRHVSQPVSALEKKGSLPSLPVAPGAPTSTTPAPTTPDPSIPNVPNGPGGIPTTGTMGPPNDGAVARPIPGK